MIDQRLQLLASNIRRFVADSAYSMADVGRALGVDRSTVQRWTTGERTPTMENLTKLADLLARDVTDFWTGPEAVPATPEQRLAIEYIDADDVGTAGCVPGARGELRSRSGLVS